VAGTGTTVEVIDGVGATTVGPGTTDEVVDAGCCINPKAVSESDPSGVSVYGGSKNAEIPG